MKAPSISITCAAHKLTTGTRITITGVGGNTAANTSNAASATTNEDAASDLACQALATNMLERTRSAAASM